MFLTSVTAWSATCCAASAASGESIPSPIASRSTNLPPEESGLRFRGENAQHALLYAFTAEPSLLNGSGHGVDRVVGLRRNQQNIRTGFERTHGGLARGELFREALHVHRVGDDQTAEAQILAQQSRQYGRGYGGRNLARLQRGDSYMRGHDGIHAGRDGRAGKVRVPLRQAATGPHRGAPDRYDCRSPCRRVPGNVLLSLAHAARSRYAHLRYRPSRAPPRPPDFRHRSGC